MFSNNNPRSLGYGFFPATPKGELNERIGEVLEEEGKRIWLALKSREKGGVSLERQLVRPDLRLGEPIPSCRMGEPCGRPGYVLDRTSGGAGAPQNVCSAVYQVDCSAEVSAT